jgi:hypothetical protein
MKFEKSNKFLIVTIIILIVLLFSSLIYIFRDQLPVKFYSKGDQQSLQNITNYQECVKAGFQREITSPKKCVAGDKTYFDAKELLPSSTIRYKLSEDDGVDLGNGMKMMSNLNCDINLTYNIAGVNYAKDFSTKDENSEKNIYMFNNQQIESFGLKVQTPELGSFFIGCLDKDLNKIDKLNGSNFKKGTLDNLYFLEKNIHERINQNEIYIEDRYNSGQINWYFEIDKQMYLVSEWQNFAEKIDIKITMYNNDKLK